MILRPARPHADAADARRLRLRAATRRRGRLREPSSSSEAEEEAAEEAAAADGAAAPAGPANLHELVGVLETPAGVRLFKAAFRENMLYKVRKYGELRARAEEEVARAQEVIDLRLPDLKRAARIDAESTADHWAIFESISQGYSEAKERASQFEAIENRARARLAGSMAVAEVVPGDAALGLRDELVGALRVLGRFAAQVHIVAAAVDLVGAFLKDPRLFRRKLMNMMMLGRAGTGKTTIAEAIGDVFARAGMFVGDRLIEAGRAELVGQYEGQTVARTRAFLVSHLDAGVIFVDEAYAITPWQDGKPEGYGSEAATAMVEFMSRYPGLYCIITAGYEKDMTRYFLPTNQGLSRRFPYKFVLHDMTPDELLDVFRRTLRLVLDPAAADAPLGAAADGDAYFTGDAYAYLRRLAAACTQGHVEYVAEDDPATRRTYRRVRTFRPRWELMHRLFENQAASMTLLADEAITVLMAALAFDDAVASGAAAPRHRAQGRAAMRDIVVHRILHVALSEAEDYLAQLRQVE
jgi:hypothetical protein